MEEAVKEHHKSKSDIASKWDKKKVIHLLKNLVNTILNRLFHVMIPVGNKIYFIPFPGL